MYLIVLLCFEKISGGQGLYSLISRENGRISCFQKCPKNSVIVNVQVSKPSRGCKNKDSLGFFVLSF